VLAYGHSVKSVVFQKETVGIRRVSATKGVTCVKLGPKPGAHGFRIAREGYAIL
jgi:hypothetical protein